MSDREPSDLKHRFTGWLAVHANWVIVGSVLVSVALVYPLLWMQPTATASQEPDGPLFRAHRLAAERLASRAHRMAFIVEARDGNLLSQAALAELLTNSERLRRDRRLGPKLLRYPNPVAGHSARVHGLFSIADAVDEALRAAGMGGLGSASEQQVRTLLKRMLGTMARETSGLSVKTRGQSSSGWRSPALLLVVNGDNDKLGGASSAVALGAASTDKEAFAREVLAHLRGEQRHIRVWGVAIDVNLTSIEQGRDAGPFIGLTILAALLLVGVLLRSYWAVAVVGLSLGALVLWLKALSNLMGLKQDQILSTIVPIAMISFGVDFAFHGIGRYREAVARGRQPLSGFRLGLAGALGALLLAMATDAAAFLSNLGAGIESLGQFGVAAAMATIASFWLLGILAPLAIMRIEQRRGPLASRSRRMLLAGAGGSIVSAVSAMAAVILMLYIEPWLGAAALGLFAVLAVLGPAVLLPRHAGSASPLVRRAWHPEAWVGALVARIARFKIPVLVLAASVTVGAVLLALRAEAHFDVKDFFSPRSDFVVGLTKFDEHVGNTSGEAALVYVEGPLHRPAALKALRAFRRKLEAVETPALSRRPDGRLQLRPGLLALLDRARPAADSSEQQLLALYRSWRAKGLEAMTPDRVRALLWLSADDQRVATAFRLRIPGSRRDKNLAAARAAVEPLAAALQRELRQLDPTAVAVFTGQPIARHASLGAILHAFRVSLLIAVVACLLLATFFMRSVRYGIVSIIPILLVVSWLYAFMVLAGYNINVVTATIGAIGIGVGIDFAVHLTMRYREELRRGLRCEAALRKTGAGTGAAILGAGLSSIVGFSILAFAPMPMFASYGLLTAAMITMAVVASLLVLPSLLAMTAPRDQLLEREPR